MIIRHWMDYLRKEHEELLDLADKIEALLEAASRHNFSEHQKVISELHLLDHRLTGILEHCHAPDRLVESDFYQHLPAEKRSRVAGEHQRIREAVASFREELKCATPDRTMAMIVPGMDVVKRLRDHVDFESGLFDRAKRRDALPKKSATVQNAARKISANKRGSSKRHKTRGGPNGMVPYTLESHPELQ